MTTTAKPKITKADTVRADLAALKDATRRLETLRRELAENVKASLEHFDTAVMVMRHP